MALRLVDEGVERPSRAGPRGIVGFRMSGVLVESLGFIWVWGS